MKLATSSADLLAQLSVVSRVASTRSAVQALSGVQLSATADGAELRATDMDVGLRVPLTATVERPGTVVLPARLTLDVLSSRLIDGQFPNYRQLLPDADTRMPVRIGRVSSRDADRATRLIVSTNAAAGTLTTVSPPGSGSGGKSSARSVRM